MNLQPYQTAAEEMKKKGEQPLRALKGLAGAGLGIASAASGTALLNRALPLLSKYIAPQTAIAGLSKINKHLGSFAKSASENGFGMNEVKEFIEGKIASEPAQENRNLIEQHSPELHSFILDSIKSGKSPIEAAQTAAKSGKYNKIIDKLKKEHKSNWLELIQELYGSGERALPQSKAALQSPEMQQPQSMQQQQPQTIKQMMQVPQGKPRSHEVSMVPIKNQGMQQEQGGQGQQALMAILQQLQQSRGG